MTLAECKEFMRLYQRGAEGERYRWVRDENEKLQDTLRHATERAEQAEAALNDLRTEFALAQVALAVAGATYTVNRGVGEALAMAEIDDGTYTCDECDTSMAEELMDLAGEALTLEAECDTLRATLKATRAELDRVLSLAVEDRKQLQEFARGALLRAMGDLSEHHWCAGWLTGTEYFLWSAVEGNQPTAWGMDELRQGDIDNLRMLRELAGGWWVWADEEAGEKFVGLDEMRQMAEAMRKIGDSARG